MTVKTSAVMDAEDQKQGMTLDELAAFVQNARPREHARRHQADRDQAVAAERRPTP